MAQPVWVLSVDLQAKTATFQSGMAEAAKSARGAFTEIKQGSGEAGGAVSTNMFEARHGVMLLGEEFGIKLPRALTAFITSIGPIGAAMEAAFPFLAIAVGATLLIQYLMALKAAGHELTEDQVKFGTAAENVFNSLNQKLLQAQIRTDELRNDHLGALRSQLELINAQSLGELVHQFSELAKEADVVFAKLQTHWYSFGEGARGAKNAADDFAVSYAAMLARGDKQGASDLLKGTRESAEKTLAKLQQVSVVTEALRSMSGVPIVGGMAGAVSGAVDDGTSKKITAQQTLLQLLKDQQSVQDKVQDNSNQDALNAKLAAAKAASALRATGDQESAEHHQKMAELQLTTERETANALLEVQRASVMQRLAVDLQFAERNRDIQLQGNKELQDAVDRMGGDVNNRLKALRDKALEIDAQHAASVASMTAKASVELNAQTLQALEQSEREKIEATQQGSAARLAAINAALKEEESKGLQETSFYRDLAKQRVQVEREANEEAAKLSAEAGKEASDNTLKMGELALTAARQNQALLDSVRRVSVQQRIDEDVNTANQEYALKLAAMARETAALDQHAKDYQNKLQAIRDKEIQLEREHENQLTAIKNQAEIERNNKVIAAEWKFNDTILAGMTQVLMGHKSFASMMNSIGNEVVSGLIQNTMKTIEMNLLGKQSDAQRAAASAYKIGLGIGGPAGMVLGPTFAAIAFSSVMAFQQGTDYVPGIGPGDKVPAMLEPGEGVVPGGVMDGLRTMARNGSMGGGTHHHITTHVKFSVSALDSAGMDEVLEKHSDKISKHIGNEIRKMNR
jgi:hypothetical protein